MATKTNFILKVSDAKLADVQKALKDANINVVSILEVHKVRCVAACGSLQEDRPPHTQFARACFWEQERLRPGPKSCYT
jgi:hypothetical protein